MENIYYEVKVLKKKARFAEENKDFKDITETLLEDVNDLNEKIKHTIPWHLEDKIYELKDITLKTRKSQPTYYNVISYRYENCQNTTST